jgi:hypothetical protein
VDGDNQQIDRIGTAAPTHDAHVVIVIDSVHVLEYPRKAAWYFHKGGDTAAETWVREHATTVLAGRATRVAGVIPTRRHQSRTGPTTAGRRRHPGHRPIRCGGDPDSRLPTPFR